MEVPDLCFGLRKALEGVREVLVRAEGCEGGSAVEAEGIFAKDRIVNVALSFRACLVKFLQNWQEEV